MRIIAGKICALRIPFVEAFAHSASNRKLSDSFVVQLIADDGTPGYGEGIARPYVTGETAETSVEYIRTQLFPAIAETRYPEVETGIKPLDALRPVTESLPVQDLSSGVIWHAARAAVELALIDCLLKHKNLSLSALLPPKRPTITYSGVITGGAVENAVQHAKRFKLFGLRQLKVKIGSSDDAARIAAVREAVGDSVSLRVDANGAFDLRGAVEITERLANFNIDSIEQPMPRGDLKDWAALKARSRIPVMADESLLTLGDAEALIENAACDFFNLRVSKCGGIANTLKIADIARQGGVRLQLGCHVGETAVLSAMGRHIAAYLKEVEFVEGSFGNLLLSEDISRNSISFGHGGRASLLRGPGLGIEIREAILEKYAHRVVKLGRRKTHHA